MEFRTKIEINNPHLKIDHRTQVMMFGSCFAQNIGERLETNKFSSSINPFGILYNPASISRVIRRIIDGQPFTLDDVRQCNQTYVSFLHHGDFSALTADECLNNINRSLEQANKDLRESNLLIVTFGTSFVYKLVETGQVVSNCHKFPASIFQRERLSIDDIVSDWSNLVQILRNFNPDLKLLFTVSPIRHWKDGAHENQLSKSTLLLAIDSIQKEHAGIDYFPSYEIVMDELRDYRFYADDMIHPSSKAINYIWEVFGNTYFTDTTKAINRVWGQIAGALTHRPFNPQSDEYKEFLRQTLLRLDDFQKKYPYINCLKEQACLKALLS